MVIGKEKKINLPPAAGQGRDFNLREESMSRNSSKVIS